MKNVFQSERVAGHRPATRRLALLAAGSLLAAGAVALIGSTRSPDPGLPVPAATGPAGLADLHRLPPVFAALYQHPEQVSLVLRAESRLTVACMARAGVPYHPDPPATGAGAVTDVPLPFGFETASVADVPVPVLAPEPTGRAVARTARALYGDPEQRATARGTTMSVRYPRTGCVADAERALLGRDRDRWRQVRLRMFEVEASALAQLDQDADVVALRAEWRSCLGAGAPADPRALLEGTPGPAARQADLACKARTDYLLRGYARLAAVERRVLAGQLDLLVTWRALAARQLAAARAVPAG